MIYVFCIFGKILYVDSLATTTEYDSSWSWSQAGSPENNDYIVSVAHCQETIFPEGEKYKDKEKMRSREQESHARFQTIMEKRAPSYLWWKWEWTLQAHAVMLNSVHGYVRVYTYVHAMPTRARMKKQVKVYFRYIHGLP